MANRVLHVANTYAKYQNLSPAKLIQSVHDDMYKKFVRTAQGKNMVGAGSAAEAKDLQDFFQSLKNYAKYQNQDSIGASVDATVIEQVLSGVQSKLSHGHKISNLFRQVSSSGQKQGMYFENDLSLVIEEVLSMGSGKTVTRGSTQLGQKTVNIAKGETINVNDYAKELVESVGKGMFNKVKQVKTNFSAVQGKIDISGLTANVYITANPKSYLFRIATLLSKANISAKSYSTMYWDKALEQRVAKLATEIRLGHTSQRRIYTDIFTKEAGTPPAVSLSLFMYLKNTKNEKLKSAANKLRFIYELTGYGQQYVDNSINDILNAEGIGHANYLIWNDPGTDNIRVRSTADIIQQMWDKIDDIIRKDSVYLSSKFI